MKTVGLLLVAVVLFLLLGAGFTWNLLMSKDWD